jgi:hypothetical protein
LTPDRKNCIILADHFAGKNELSIFKVKNGHKMERKLNLKEELFKEADF